jgi:peptidyl-prolyl cis-trans isomerase A (cyclophilin A)
MSLFGVLSRAACVAAVFAFAGCAGTDQEEEPAAEQVAPPPAPAAADAPAPVEAAYWVRFETTRGNFVVEVHPEWAPKGAERFKELVTSGYYDGCKFFRVIDGFMVQFGINGSGALNAEWREKRIPDDPVTQKNTRGRITFATSGPNSRTTQVFINFDNNTAGGPGPDLDGMGFAPFGEVVEGMDVVDKLYDGYGEGAPRGKGPRQDLIQSQGNTYLEAEFPKLDGIVKASLLETAPVVVP